MFELQDLLLDGLLCNLGVTPTSSEDIMDQTQQQADGQTKRDKRERAPQRGARACGACDETSRSPLERIVHRGVVGQRACFDWRSSSESSVQHPPKDIAEVLRVRASESLPYDKSVKRYAQDDGFSGRLGEK